MSAHRRHQGGTLGFIILIVATAVLMAWLLVELARHALGDFRLSRAHEGSLQGAPSGSSSIGSAPEHVGVTLADRPRPITAESEDPAEEDVLYGEADVERAVRDRLYGSRRGRRD